MRRGVLSALFIACVVGSASLFAQKNDSSSTDERLQKIEEALRTLSSQVAELTSRLRVPQPASLVETPPAAPDITLTGVPTNGSPHSKIVLIEFSDFQCPFCARHAQTAYREIQAEYVNSGKIQYAFRNFPLEHIHPAARQAAEAAVCAGEQRKFWEFHDLVFANPRELALTNLKEHARAVQVDLAKFEVCISDIRTSDRVTRDVGDARRLGLGATPAFIIGEIQANGNARELRRIVGAQPFQVFKLALDELMRVERYVAC